MLVLGRKPNQGAILEIGHQKIEVLFLGTRDNLGRIAFRASPEVRIYRDEIYDRVVEARREENPLEGTIWG